MLRVRRGALDKNTSTSAASYVPLLRLPEPVRSESHSSGTPPGLFRSERLEEHLVRLSRSQDSISWPDPHPRGGVYFSISARAVSLHPVAGAAGAHRGSTCRPVSLIGGV